MKTAIWFVVLWLFVSVAVAQQVITVNDDLAAKVEELGAKYGTIVLAKGDFKLKRPVTCPEGTWIFAAGGFADRGRGTNIQQAFDGEYMFRWNKGGGGMSRLSLTVAPNMKAGAAIRLDGTNGTSRPTWFQIDNVVIPRYTGMGSFKVGLSADGSAWKEPGSQGVRDLTIVGLFVYGVSEHAIRFNRVVNVSILGGSFGPGGEGRAQIELVDCDSIHVSASTLWGDFYIRNSKNVSWMGGRVDGLGQSGNENLRVLPCNIPKDLK